ncbi:class I SAM-dependent methyltransferase [Roseofilum sp. Belize BBD 4]|uniref:class I SAM-dependent methyltransferase n=1 Tax=Roseofilum sp. Belize BBD 4 TaxID=2821500 RepID=UPI00298DC5DD|nr:class I SAM-dependent methyltransferase [Roseofilum sp. Belize BBD 4]
MNIMTNIDEIRNQFNSTPYYNCPLEDSPKKNKIQLYCHNMVNSFYRRDQKVINSEGKIILDAGCGSGYKSLILAEANPGAKIVGIDMSDKSIEIARERLKYHGFYNSEFHCIPIEKIPSLGIKFDYINCDDVLYLVPGVTPGLKAFKSVLKPDGIIRANLHSSLQRQGFFRGQRIWQKLGFMDGAPEEEDYEIVRSVMRNLKDIIDLKRTTWREQQSESVEWLGANYLLLGDTGIEIPELFAFLRESNLEFISMLNWHYWDLLKLFKNWDDLPMSLMFQLSELSIEDQLHLHELFHPKQRLLDFFCGHPQGDRTIVPVEEWTDKDWKQAQVHLHPQLRTEDLKEEAMTAISETRSLNFNDYLCIDPLSPSTIESTALGALLPLFDSPCSFLQLLQRWQTLHPINPITWEANTETEATQQLKSVIIPLYESGHLLLESQE